MRRCILLLSLSISLVPALHGAEPPVEPARLFARDNLIAWCIVPFDAKHRAPAQRAAMLKELGFSKFAYDWRAEHIPTFDAEIAAMRKADIDIVGWWFPPVLNNDARMILAKLRRNELQTQLWVALDDSVTAGADQQARVAAAVDLLRPIVDAAAEQGCSVGLYNHGGWFGEPENQLAIVAALDAANVGVVYNLHHGHAHVDRLADLLPKMLPHLYAINLNGMDRAGDQHGRKILPLGNGQLDLELLRTIHQSGYRGPIGLIGHTQDDAESRLRDNLDGLERLVKQLD